MTDTTNTIVTGLQNVPVSSTTPDDGYVLTYVGSAGEWTPKAPQKLGLNQEYFTTDGYWTAPEGITTILAIGAGGGGAGGGGGRNTHGGAISPTIGQGAGAGGGSIQVQVPIAVIPGKTYSIKIGNGGIGGQGAQNISSFDIGLNGTNGKNTLIKDEYDNILFCALGAGLGLGGACISDNRVPAIGGANIASTPSPINRTENPLPMAYGGSCDSNGNPSGGQINILGGFSAGAAGSSNGNFDGGGGGGAGPQGPGGDGGNGDGTMPTNGVSGTANTGAGGGGGGGGGQLHGSFEAGDGGDGGSGYLYIIW